MTDSVSAVLVWQYRSNKTTLDTVICLCYEACNSEILIYYEQYVQVNIEDCSSREEIFDMGRILTKRLQTKVISHLAWRPKSVVLTLTHSSILRSILRLGLRKRNLGHLWIFLGGKQNLPEQCSYATESSYAHARKD